jgi:hypothetical protein
MLTNRYFNLLITFLFAGLLCAQTNIRKQYIQEFSQIAVDEMNRSGIPASITLAQGILESGNGQSELARKSNNHFGIKCHNTWDGKKVFHDDDRKRECFRAYDNPRHSYEDHTDFLVRGSRYEFLFDLELTDYRGWAKGLKKAGYATAPDYADKLIRIIEDENLHKFDFTLTTPLLVSEDTVVTKVTGPTVNEKGKVIKKSKRKFLIHRLKYHENKTPYVILQHGESIESIADSLHMRIAVLLDINDAGYETVFNAGEAVYIDYKKGRAKQKFMIAPEGTTMRAISQQYAIPIQKLYRYNNFKIGQQPQKGEHIRLRSQGLLEKFKD